MEPKSGPAITFYLSIVSAVAHTAGGGQSEEKKKKKKKITRQVKKTQATTSLQLMKRERRTLSVPSLSFPDEGSRGPGGGGMMDSSGFLGTPPQQGTGASSGAGWAPQQQQPSISSQSLGKPPPNFNRSRSASTSSLSTPTAATPVPGTAAKKKTVTACQRCRTRKIRCDGALPACKSCVKAGVDCIEVDRTGDNNMPRR